MYEMILCEMITGYGIESAGGVSIGEALKVNTALTELNLSCEEHE